MDREQATEKLIGLVKVAESGKTLVPIKEIYVFGSYARGALNPNDIDVVVIYEEPGQEWWKQYKNQL